MENKEWTVYRHTSPSGKHYIGITSQPIKYRWVGGKGYKHCVLFQKAIDKYGWDNIKHEVLFSGLSEDRAKQLEISLIRHYKGLGLSYNITDGGDGALGREVSDITRKKMRERKLGKPLSEEHKEKIRKYTQTLKGIPRTDEVKRKLHEANKGKKPSPQTMAALIEYNKTHPLSAERLKKMHEASKKKGYKAQAAALNRNRVQIGLKRRKPVVQFSLDGQFISEFTGAKFAELETGVDATSIARCCKGTAYKAGKFLWMYKDDYIKNKQDGTFEPKMQNLIKLANRLPGSFERSEAWRKAKSESQKGIERRSDACKMLMLERSKRACSKPVLQMTDDGTLVAVYSSIRTASAATGFAPRTINKCCTGVSPSVHSFKFKFISYDEYEQYKEQLAA